MPAFQKKMPCVLFALLSPLISLLGKSNLSNAFPNLPDHFYLSFWKYLLSEFYEWRGWSFLYFGHDDDLLSISEIKQFTGTKLPLYRTKNCTK